MPDLGRLFTRTAHPQAGCVVPLSTGGCCSAAWRRSGPARWHQRSSSRVPPSARSHLMPVPYAGLPTPSPPAPPTLVVSRDRALVDVLDRLAAAAGAELDVHSDLPGRSVWLAAGLVLVGSDLAAEVAGSLPRRAGVAMVGLAPTGVLATRDDDLIWRQAVDVGA